MTLDYSRLYAPSQGTRPAAVAHMEKYAALAANGHPHLTALDIGCGWGYLLEALENAGIPCLGIDVDPGQTSIAQAAGGNAILVTDTLAWLDEMISAGQRWHTIYLLDVLEHLAPADQIAILQRIASALAPGGRAIIKSPNPDSAVGMRMMYIDYTHRFTPTADLLRDALMMSGFSSVTIRDELPWVTRKIGIRPFFSRDPEQRRKARHDVFYAMSQAVFRPLRRWQVASEIGLEAARGLPMTPNFVCIADK